MAFRRKTAKNIEKNIFVLPKKREWAKNKILEPECAVESTRSLIETARKDEDLWTRLTAFKKLGKNADALAEIAMNYDGLGYDDTRKLAVRQLTRMARTLKSPAALVCIASHSANKKSRMAAIDKLAENPVALKNVVKYGCYDDALTKAVEKLAGMVEKLDDPEALRFVALYSADSKKKEAASKKLQKDDVNFVVEIAKHHHDPAKRKSMLKALGTNIEALREIARCGYYLNTSKEAIRKLAKLSRELNDPLILNGLPKLR